ncbi:unnamed protein product, partial [Polarella glacialis]
MAEVGDVSAFLWPCSSGGSRDKGRGDGNGPGYEQLHDSGDGDAGDACEVVVDDGSGGWGRYMSVAFCSVRRSAREAVSISGKRQKQLLQMKFVLEMVFLVCIIYYIDLALDINALLAFWDMQQYYFFGINLAAILIAWLITFYEIINIGDHDFGISYTETVVLGVCYPLQLHILFLTYLCIKAGKKHPVIISAKFAEAAVEAVTSALVQLYSLVFCHEALEFATCHIHESRRFLLGLSVASSLVSIGAAFSVFDLRSYGVGGLPGGLTSAFSLAYWAVALFRVCEITSRLTSLAAFQLATRPYGGWVCMGTDAFLMFSIIMFNGGKAMYFVPSMFGMVNPMLERGGVVTAPHWQYYSIRLLELCVMAGSAVYMRGGLSELMVLYDYDVGQMLLMVCGTTTTLMFALLPVLRYLARDTIAEYKDADWANAPFSDLQMMLRNKLIEENHENIMTFSQPLSKALSNFAGLVFTPDDISNIELETRIGALLCLGHNCPAADEEFKIGANANTAQTNDEEAETVESRTLSVSEATPMLHRKKSTTILANARSMTIQLGGNSSKDKELWNQLKRALAAPQLGALASSVVLSHVLGPQLLQKFLGGSDEEDLATLTEIVPKLLDSGGTQAAHRLCQAGGFEDELLRMFKSVVLPSSDEIEEQWAMCRLNASFSHLMALLLSLVVKRPYPELSQVSPGVWFDFFKIILERGDHQVTSRALPWFPTAAECNSKSLMQQALETLVDFFLYVVLNTDSMDDDVFVMKKLLEFCGAILDVEDFHEGSIVGTWGWTRGDSESENRICIARGEEGKGTYTAQLLFGKDGAWVPMREPLDGTYLARKAEPVECGVSGACPVSAEAGLKEPAARQAQSMTISSVRKSEVNLRGDPGGLKLRGGNGEAVFVDEFDQSLTEGVLVRSGVQVGDRLVFKGGDTEFQKKSPEEIVADMRQCRFQGTEVLTFQQAAQAKQGSVHLIATLRAGNETWSEDVNVDGDKVSLGKRTGTLEANNIKMDEMGEFWVKKNCLTKNDMREEGPMRWSLELSSEKVVIDYQEDVDAIQMRGSSFAPIAGNVCARIGNVSFRAISLALNSIIKRSRRSKSNEVREASEALEALLQVEPNLAEHLHRSQGVLDSVKVRLAIRALRKEALKLPGGSSVKGSCNFKLQLQMKDLFEKRVQAQADVIVQTLGSSETTSDLTLLTNALEALSKWLPIE